MKFRSGSVDALVKGYSREGGRRHCLFCGSSFEEGVVYAIGDGHYTGERAAREHIAHAHGEIGELLLEQAVRAGALSSLQGTVVLGMLRDKRDSEIAKELGGKAASTVRNHRFQLRRRARQATLLLAVMELVNRAERGGETMMEFKAAEAIQDERFAVSTAEAHRIAAKHFDETGALKLDRLPRKHKERVVVLDRIAGLFEPGRRYSEQEVNGVIAPVTSDYVTVRRSLIDFGFLDRADGGGEYWRR